MGKILSLSWFGLNEFVILRFFNILFSTVTVIYTLRLARLFTSSKAVHLLALIIITNIPMFTFLSASVNYDNLTNMFASMTIYYLFLYIKSSMLNDLLKVIILINLGLITKVTFIPLALICTIILIISIIKKSQDKSYFHKTYSSVRSCLVLVVICIISILLSSNLYIRNFYYYQKIIPACEQVTSYENCRLNPTFVRDENLRSDPKTTLLTPYKYFLTWGDLMLTRSMGILGHDSLYKSTVLLIPYKIIFSLSLILLLRLILKKERFLLTLFIIAVFYTVILAYYHNYRNYITTGVIDIALQGRYLFPIVVPVALLTGYALLNTFKNKRICIIIFAIVSTVFILGDYIHFKRNVPDLWYFDTSLSRNIRTLNQKFK